MIKKVFALLLLITVSSLTFAQSAKKHWVDSVFESMNSNQKIGQLFMVRLHASADDPAIHEIENKIKSHELGGILFSGMAPVRQIELINHFQKLADVPLLIAQEIDFGHPDSLFSLPPPVLLGAIRNDTLVYLTAREMAMQLKRIGVNMVIGLNPKVSTFEAGTPIDFSSFGEDKSNVAAKSVAFMRGLQDNGILVVTRNFPLRRINVLEIDNGVPIVEAETDSLQRLPYAALIQQNLTGVMSGVQGYNFKVTETSSFKKTSYSSEDLATLITAKSIKKNLHFVGLSLIDLGNIKSNDDKAKPGDKEVFALQQENDIIVDAHDVSAIVKRIKKAAKKNDAFDAQVNGSVKRMLEAKFDGGLWSNVPVSRDNLTDEIQSPHTQLLRTKAYENAITIVRDKKSILPIKILETRSFVFVATKPEDLQSELYQYLKKYAAVSSVYATDIKSGNVKELFKKYTTIIIPVFFQTPPEIISSFKLIASSAGTSADVIVCDFGNPAFIRDVDPEATVVTSYMDSPVLQKAVPQVLFGALSATGILPVSLSTTVKYGSGVNTKSIQRLSYSIPEDAKMESSILQQIDSIAAEAIRIHATPGCQVWVARKGKVIYEKSFGFLTYDNQKPVTPETLYDLASVTKVSATLQTAMFMYERGLIDLNKKVSYYLPELKGTNKKDITILDMLTHQAGLVPFIPMYPQTVKDTTYLPNYYSRKRDAHYPLQVSSNLFASFALRDSVWSWVVKSKMNERPMRTPYSYKYSDLGFLILQHLAEKILNQPLDEFMQQNYYEPLGAYTTGFNPLNRFPVYTIAPTEDDKIYRKSFVAGTVHDERAAMMGGVAGHAGLFSSANDLGKLGQMLLQGGTYGGIQYYKPETVNLFTGKRFKSSRRGIGWDKPVQSNDQSSPTSVYASPKTFGHTGFTGTCIWVDPEFDLVYIFLSNRVYPDRNNKLSNANIRTRIQDVIYKSIFNYVDQQLPRYIVNDYAINAGSGRPFE